MEDIRVRELGLPPMSEREYIKAGDTEGLEKFDAKLAGKTQEKVEQKVMEENK